jgi:periplasmic protein CpxP/Spy
MNTQPVSRKLLNLAAIGALGAGLMLQPSLSLAQGAAPTAAPSSPAIPSATQPAAPMRTGAARSDAQIDAHLKQLHTQLKITAAEEQQWNSFAQIVRDNEHQISGLLEQRRQNAKTMSALDNLTSYQQITQAHADGLAKLVPAFDQLYSKMPDAQKKVADNVFNQRIERRTAHSSHSPQTKASSG